MATNALKQNAICVPNVNSRGEPYKDPETDSWVKYLTAEDFFNKFVEIQSLKHQGTSLGTEYNWESVTVTKSELDDDGKLTVYIDASEEGFSGRFGSDVPVSAIEDGELVVKDLGRFTFDEFPVDGGTY